MKKQLEITEDQAKEMYDSGIESLKNIAQANFPELFHKEKRWEDFGEIKGYRIYNGFRGCKTTIRRIDATINETNINLWPTENEAKACLIESQLAQWRNKANGEPLNQWANWGDDDAQYKYTIVIKDGNVCKSSTLIHYEFLSFKRTEIRNRFMEDHKTLLEEWAKLKTTL